ncbi:MAG: dethiobiotin synthase [Isosphaeraceae bacterium]|nr:dethiobiotin synthase [Isosphaeraceae bacterium]
MTRLPGLFVVGTDTGVGKTRVAAGIARCLVEAGRRVGVLKPVATGLIRKGDRWRCEDAEALIAALGVGIEPERVTPLAFEEPLAPPVAARRQGRPLDFAQVLDATRDALAWWADRAEIILVEGVGGLLCPLAEGATVADLAVALDFPLVVVARRGLGTLNHTLLTVEAARWRGLRVAGIVLNGSDADADPLALATNPGELTRRLGGVALLAEVPHLTDPAALWREIRDVDWEGSSAPPRLV